MYVALGDHTVECRGEVQVRFHFPNGHGRGFRGRAAAFQRVDLRIQSECQAHELPPPKLKA